MFVPGSKVPIKIVPRVDKTVNSPFNLQLTTVLHLLGGAFNTPEFPLLAADIFFPSTPVDDCGLLSFLAPPTAIRRSNWHLPRSFYGLWGTNQSVTTKTGCNSLLCDSDQTLTAPNAALLQTTCKWCGNYGGTSCCRAFPHYVSSRQRWSDSASRPDLLCDDFMQVSLQSLLWICISNTFEPAG